MHTGKPVFAQLMEQLPLDDLSSLRGALRWASQGQAFQLFGSVPVDGLCATDVSRKSQRYRSLFSRIVLLEEKKRGHSTFCLWIDACSR
jgi:hypothetical protein